MQLPPRWILTRPPDPGATAVLADAISVPRTLAALLAQRGFDDPDAARRFLRPALEGLADPYHLAGMDAAVDAVARAVRAGGPILIHGDYDVDGQCGSALLTRALRTTGARVEPFVPHRMRDGYDFGPAGLAVARELGARLIITCDCGITALEATQRAGEVGIEVIVTDHHLPGPTLPAATAVVDPQRPDDRSGLTALCGAGIAFKLVQALVEPLGLPAHLPLHLLDYVALATVADVVPLVGENRILVRHGLKLLNRSRWPGLRALVAAAGLAGQEIRASHVGYILGPRLNAAGRIGDAGEGLRLLLEDDGAEAERQARQLEVLNTERQDLDQRILTQALEQIEREVRMDRSPVLVLASDEWHPGVVGIVASRVVERFGRPTFLIGLDGEVGKGSGRSISGFDLNAALRDCADLLERFGGHRMAAGLTVRRDRLEAFRERFTAVAGRTLDPATLGPEQRVDLEITLDEATLDLERLCRHLEPCGMGNPAPVFLTRGAELLNWQFVGVTGGHLRGYLRDARGGLSAIGFQFADRVGWLGDQRVDAAFRLDRNDYNGQVQLQAKLLALAPHQRS
jgi:single-stranded-DNA-specific exonuclease